MQLLYVRSPLRAMQSNWPPPSAPRKRKTIQSGPASAVSHSISRPPKRSLMPSRTADLHWACRNIPVWPTFYRHTTEERRAT